MEFNNIANSDSPIITNNPKEESVTLHSPSRNNISSYKDALKIQTSLSSNNLIYVSHDIRDAKLKFGKNNIKSSLITIYGKNGRAAISSKEMETLALSLDDFPAKLEYTLTVLENDIPVEYKTEYNIPIKDSTAILSATGKYESAKSIASLPNAIEQLDGEIVNIKNILYDFSSIYDINEKKVVSLHDFIINLSSSIDKLSKEIDEIKKNQENM